MIKSTPIESKIKARLIKSEREIDHETLDHLQLARQHALQQTSQTRWRVWASDFLNWLKQPSGNMVMASLLAIALLVPQLDHQPFTKQDPHQTALLELIEADDTLLDETADPDFYLWLAEVDGQQA